MNSFAYQLKQFSLSVDYVEDNVYKEINTMLRSYFDKMEAQFYEIQIDGYEFQRRENRVPALQTVLTHSSKDPVTTIIKTDGSYTGQTTYAYDKGENLWIVNKAKAPLKDNHDYLNLWQSQHGPESLPDDFPDYWDFSELADTKTSIILPLKSKSEKTFGFLNLEFAEYIEPRPDVKDELKALVCGLSNLFKLKTNTERLIKNTKEALSEVKKDIRPISLNLTIKKPQLFFAYPLDSCNQVRGTIRHVLDKFQQVEIIDWQEMNESGSITKHLLEAISSCKYGICYFSEIKQEEPREYDFSLNVTFEAGMLQSLTNNPASEPMGWIPIWESSERDPKPPFDFAQERSIVVPRLQNGSLNEERFNFLLTDRMEGLIMQVKQLDNLTY